MIVYSHHFFAMHTRFAMVIPGLDEERGDDLARGARQKVEEWEQCLSGFRSGAELQIINELAAEREMPVSGSMARILDLCAAYHRVTGGLFDPAVSRGDATWADVIWNQDSGGLSFARSGVKLDMGGIGKGIALDEVVAYLRAEGVNDALLNFGESSIAGMGKHPYGEGWLIGDKDGFLLSDEFLSISGLQDIHGSGRGDSGAHIYHPIKGELVRSNRRAMVKCDSAVEAEVLSTALYLADKKECEQLKLHFPNAEMQVE